MLRPFALAAAVSVLVGAAPVLAQTAPASDSMPGMAMPAAPAAAVVITPNPTLDIVANLKASGQFTTLLKALDGSGLTPLLQDKAHSFTLFAPTDAAFAALPPGTLDTLLKPANAAQLQQLIAYHVVATKLAADQVAGHAATPVPSAINKPITVDGTGAAIKVNDATVIQAAAPASNGVIYVIDKVLTPPQ